MKPLSVLLLLVIFVHFCTSHPLQAGSNSDSPTDDDSDDSLAIGTTQIFLTTISKYDCVILKDERLLNFLLYTTHIYSIYTRYLQSGYKNAGCGQEAYPGA